MFAPKARTASRAELLGFAAGDPRISAAAITGSAADDREDRWSDIDLAFGIAEDITSVLDDWTARLYDQYKALHHLDIHAGPWLYRVFLLPGTLQVDLAFVPAAEFRALGPTFRVVFGAENEPQHTPAPLADPLIGMAWLYALHARTAIARGQFWQALHMIDGLRDHALALACRRQGLPTSHAKGVDQLPAAVTAPFANSLVQHLDSAELSRAFQAAVQATLAEILLADPQLGARLQPSLQALYTSNAASSAAKISAP